MRCFQNNGPNFRLASVNKGKKNGPDPFTDHGPAPYIFNIPQTAKQNKTYRTVLWTGDHMQLTVMSIPPCGEIALQTHSGFDALFQVEEGQGLCKMGQTEHCLDIQCRISRNCGLAIPAGTWFTIRNLCPYPLKLYSILAPHEENDEKELPVAAKELSSASFSPVPWFSAPFPEDE